MDNETGEVQWCDQAEVCRRFKLSTSSLYRYVRSGKFPTPVKMGRSRYWPKEVLDRMEQEQMRRCLETFAPGMGAGRFR